MDIPKFCKERLRVPNTREAYIIISDDENEKVSGYRNSSKRFITKEFDGKVKLVYKCKLRLVKSIEESKDSGRIHMYLDQFLTEEEIEKFFPEVSNELKAIKERKKQKTLECQRNRMKNLSKRENDAEIRKLTRGRSIRECAKESLV